VPAGARAGDRARRQRRPRSVARLAGFMIAYPGSPRTGRRAALPRPSTSAPAGRHQAPVALPEQV